MRRPLIVASCLITLQAACVPTKVPPAAKTNQDQRAVALRAEVQALLADIKEFNKQSTPRELKFYDSVDKLSAEQMEAFVASPLFDATIKEAAKQDKALAVANAGKVALAATPAATPAAAAPTPPQASPAAAATPQSAAAAAAAAAEPQISKDSGKSDESIDNTALTAGAGMMIFAGLIDTVPAIGHFWNATGHGSSTNRWTAGNVLDHGSNLALNLANVVVGAIILGYGDDEIPKELVYISSGLLLADAIFTIKAGVLYGKEAFDIVNKTAEAKDGKVLFTTDKIKVNGVEETLIVPKSKAYEWDRRFAGRAKADGTDKTLAEAGTTLKTRHAKAIEGIQTEAKALGIDVPAVAVGDVKPVVAAPVIDAPTKLNMDLPAHTYRLPNDALLALKDGKKPPPFEISETGADGKLRMIKLTPEMDTRGNITYLSDLTTKELPEVMPFIQPKKTNIGAGVSSLLAVISTVWGISELVSSVGHVQDDLGLAAKNRQGLLKSIDQRARRIYELKASK